MKVFLNASAVHRFIMSLWWKCSSLCLLYTVLLCHYNESVLRCFCCTPFYYVTMMKVFLIASAVHRFVMSLWWKCSWLRLLYTVLLCHYDESVLDCVCCTPFYYVTIMKVFLIASAVHRFIMSLWWKCSWLRLLYTVLLCHYNESVLDCVCCTPFYYVTLMKVFLNASAVHRFIMSLWWKCSSLRLLYTVLLCHYNESVLDCVCCTPFYYVFMMKVFLIASAVHRFIMSL